MVFCGAVDPEKATSKEIEKQLSDWSKTYDKAIKILLLGAGESGKTTIIKQMKIIHINGFTPEERKEKCDDIRSNILESITTIVHNMDKLEIPLGLQANQEAADFVRRIDKKNFIPTQEFYSYVEKLWRDRGVQQSYLRRNEYQLIDCAKYFLDKVEVVRLEDYEPTIQDILHSRRKTTDIQKIEFEVKIPKKYGGGLLNFWVFDVGGQRGERKKWIQVFVGIQAVLFLVSSSCFDLVIEEDNKTNRLQESITIFKSVWGSRFLKDSGFIVFLNKQDILKDKVVHQQKSIGTYFPEYADYKLDTKDRTANEEEEYLRTRCFIRDKFLEIASQTVEWEGKKVTPGMPALPNDKKKGDCYCHFTTATDTNNVKLVFDDVHNMIVRWNLEQIGVNY